MRFDGAETRSRLRSARGKRRLTVMAEHHRQGRISAVRVKLSDFAFRHVGEDETSELQSALVDVALAIGRAQRFAARRQRHAILLRQGGECATTGCRNTIDHIHQEIPWSQGGPTDLGAMTVRCTVCHTHVRSRDGTIRTVA